MDTTTTSETSAAGIALAGVVDRAEIERLVHRLGVALDESDFDGLRALVTQDVTVATPGGTASGTDAVVVQAARNHDPADVIQHQVTGVLVDLDGDTASVRANLVVTFAPGPGTEPRFRQGGVYRFAARRVGGEWRLAAITTRAIWQEGERPTVGR